MALKAAEPPSAETLLLWEREQARLKTRVVHGDTEAWQRDPAFSGLRRVGGVDVSFVNGDSSGACASLVVLSYPELKVVYEDSHMVRLQAPYVSGFLAFREVPFLVELVQRLQEKEPGLMPQVLLVDGNGVLHQRGFGVACHLGVLTDLPCIGVAKKLLQVDGLENNSLHKEKIVLLQAGGDTFPLMGDSGTVLGMVSGPKAVSRPPNHPTTCMNAGWTLSSTYPPTNQSTLRHTLLGLHSPRAPPGDGCELLPATLECAPAERALPHPQALKSHDHSTKPLYVSVGHRISLEVAVRLTHLCCRFRIPEPIRQADIRSREHIRRTLGHPGSPAQRQERRQKEQRPKACPGAPAGPCSLPEDCGRDSSTDLKDPQPGFQEQQKDQQSEGSGHHEDSDLWPPSPVWVQSPPREEDL